MGQTACIYNFIACKKKKNNHERTSFIFVTCRWWDINMITVQWQRWWMELEDEKENCYVRATRLSLNLLQLTNINIKYLII